MNDTKHYGEKVNQLRGGSAPSPSNIELMTLTTIEQCIALDIVTRHRWAVDDEGVNELLAEEYTDAIFDCWHLKHDNIPLSICIQQNMEIVSMYYYFLSIFNDFLRT